jgi:hypothetical protein
MSREGVDHALARLRDERDRISASLLDLENHKCYQLLEGAELTGETKRRWDAAQDDVITLWLLFDAYVNVLDDAEDLRRRNPRPEAVITELTWLLSGRPIEQGGEEVPLERRTLLGPATERLSLDEAVARMTAVYDEVAETIVAVDAAWAVLLPKLVQADEALRDLAELVRDLDGAPDQDPDLRRAAGWLDQIRRAVRTDPLALVDDDGRTDTGAVDEVLAALAELRQNMADAARLRRDYADRVRAVEETLGRIEETVAEAGRTRAVVQVKILFSALPEVADPVPALRDQLAEVDLMRRRGGWAEAGRWLARLEAVSADALTQARGTLRTIGGLLERRGELRGRLEAYAAKAARLGHAEDAELARLHREARDLLWAAPCDLEQATAAVARYQHTLHSLVTRADK